jgi:hypothetical protein
MTNDNAKRNKDFKYTKIDIQDDNDNDNAVPPTVTNLGDTSRDITDTADVSRASIAKGGGIEESRSAADMLMGKMRNDESIQGVTQDNNNLERRKEQLANPQDNTSKKKVVNSGTSLKKDKSIDKADIYSTGESGTRHIERAQKKPPKRVDDKEKGSWKIKEEAYKKND